QGHSAALASREAGDRSLPVEVGDESGDDVAGTGVGGPLVIGGVADHGEADRRFVIEVVALIEHAQAQSAAVGHAAGGRLDRAGEHAAAARLPVAVAADDADHVAGLDSESHRVEDDASGVFEVKGFGPEQMCHNTVQPSSPHGCRYASGAEWTGPRYRVDGPSGAGPTVLPARGRPAGPTSQSDVGCEPFRRLRLGPVRVRDSDRSSLCVTDCFVFISVFSIGMLAELPRDPECIRLAETHQNMTDRPVVSHLRQGQTGASLVSAVGNKKRENVKKLASAVSMIAASALVLSACGSGEGGDSGEDYLACMVSDSGGWDDQSFNQSGREGLNNAKDNLGIDEKLAESQGDADFG